MPITLTCPSCNQQCAVKEEYAGMQVRCPRCPAVIPVPALPPSVPVAIVEPEPMAIVETTPAPGQRRRRRLLRSQAFRRGPPS